MEVKEIHADDFYLWLETCPINYRERKIDGDYVEIGFFEIYWGDEDE